MKLGKFILVQFTGGQGAKIENYDSENHGRNYNKGQEVVNLLREQLPNVNIIVFGHDNEQEPLLNTMAFNNFGGNPKFVDKIDFMILAKYCVSFISIDSSLQHMCSNKPFNKKGVVLWGTSKPEMFGYTQNKNLISDYPYCVEIDPKKIVDEFLNQEMS
jgi:ADP-heptose:LPS heptosyltransferase